MEVWLRFAALLRLLTALLQRVILLSGYRLRRAIRDRGAGAAQNFFFLSVGHLVHHSMLLTTDAPPGSTAHAAWALTFHAQHVGLKMRIDRRGDGAGGRRRDRERIAAFEMHRRNFRNFDFRRVSIRRRNRRRGDADDSFCRQAKRREQPIVEARPDRGFEDADRARVGDKDGAGGIDVGGRDRIEAKRRYRCSSHRVQRPQR